MVGTGGGKWGEVSNEQRALTHLRRKSILCLCNIVVERETKRERGRERGKWRAVTKDMPLNASHRLP